MSKDIDFLRKKQELPLKNKIALTKIKVKHFYNSFSGKVYLSWSGGKDSTVLKDIIEEMGLDIPKVFSNTGLEYPELVDFVKDEINDKDSVRITKRNGTTIKHYYNDNLFIIYPRYTFKEVIDKEGYPIISKRTSRFIKDLQNPTDNNKVTRYMRLTGIMNNGETTSVGKLSNKWRNKFFEINNMESLDYEDKVDFKVSHRCCNYLKKQPFKHFQQEFDLKPIIATMANESNFRLNKYLDKGCNIYDSKNPQSNPISFWTTQDILNYIKVNDLDIPEVYGDIIIDNNDKLVVDGVKRTGCVFCAFGVHLEDEPNRFQKLKKTHPKLHKYAMDNLGLKKVLDYIDVPTE